MEQSISVENEYQQKTVDSKNLIKAKWQPNRLEKLTSRPSYVDHQ